MNILLATQLREVIEAAETRPALRCESQLRVAANLLSNADAGEISATTVVGVLGSDDVPAFEALVAEIADELDLEARVRLHVGSFSVRMSRRSASGPQAFVAANSQPEWLRSNEFRTSQDTNVGVC